MSKVEPEKTTEPVVVRGGVDNLLAELAVAKHRADEQTAELVATQRRFDEQAKDLVAIQFRAEEQAIDLEAAQRRADDLERKIIQTKEQENHALGISRCVSTVIEAVEKGEQSNLTLTVTLTVIGGRRERRAIEDHE